jgi:hypothetical protein
MIISSSYSPSEVIFSLVFCTHVSLELMILLETHCCVFLLALADNTFHIVLVEVEHSQVYQYILGVSLTDMGCQIYTIFILNWLTRRIYYILWNFRDIEQFKFIVTFKLLGIPQFPSIKVLLSVTLVSYSIKNLRLNYIFGPLCLF